MTAFDWQCHPQAEEWLVHLLEECKAKNSKIAEFEEKLLQKTSIRLFDLIDHFTVEFSASIEYELSKNGFEQESVMPAYRLFTHPGAKLASVLVKESSSKHPVGCAVKVESLSQFLMVHHLEKVIEGSILSPYRRAAIYQENGVFFLCVERRAARSLEPIYSPESSLNDYLLAQERLKTRSRNLLSHTLTVIEEVVSLVGKDTAAWITLEVEREYWQARNLAAQVQKNRQDSFGIGWANHDHHTFRSSRKNFTSLVRLFETLGFHCRERFYAGAQAGWGAQIMENPVCGLIVFLDVDLAPDEVEIDFAHHPLPEQKSLGTVGLWCALHGDSILEAGMHHLEAQFAFEKLSSDLASQNIKMMDPFSHFEYLKQAFTKAELWPVDPSHLEALLKQGLITHAQADQFLSQGALGSHLENLQRNYGYKGFNKEGINSIIKKTDPRIVSA